MAAARSGSVVAATATLVTATAAAVPGRALRMATDWPTAWRGREMLLLAWAVGFATVVERRATAVRRSARKTA